MHYSTADSHYNLGLLYRLNGELTKSKKELRISKKNSLYMLFYTSFSLIS